MNETIKAILERRSTRSYKSDMPKPELLEQIMKCALYAPSALNKQECHITQITDANIIDELNRAARVHFDDAINKRLTERNGGDEDFSVFYFAPCVFVISVEGDDEYHNAVDTGITAQNICIAAQALGLSSCIIGLTRPLFTKDSDCTAVKNMSIPATHKPVIAVAVGYANAEMPTPDRKAGRAHCI